MKNSFIEIYKNALPDDVCNSLISIFDRENMSELGSKVTQSKTFWGERKDLYSALELGLDDINYHYKEFIDDLDYIVSQKIFEYNNKYKVWSDDLNENLIEEDIESIDTAEKLNNKYPMILKTSVGSTGVGVMFVESEKSLNGIVQLLYRENK